MENYYVTPEQLALAEARGIPAKNVTARVYYRNWSVERAITEPVQKENPLKGKWVDLAKENGIVYQQFYLRVHTLGWTEEKAATTPMMNRSEAAQASNRTKGFKGYTEEELKLMEKNNLSKNNVSCRINAYGWTREKALNTPKLNRSEVGKLGIQAKRRAKL